MQLKENSHRALRAWLSPETWYSNRTYDEQRFYNFVDAYSKEHGTSLEEDAIIQEICEYLESRGRLTNALRNIAASYAHTMRRILEFLEHAGR